jgi:hypothetical protein
MTTNLIYGYNIFFGIILLALLIAGLWAFIVFLRNFKAQVAAAAKEKKDPTSPQAHDEPTTDAESTEPVIRTIVQGPKPKIEDLDTLRGRGESTGAGKIRYYEVISERRHRV